MKIVWNAITAVKNAIGNLLFIGIILLIIIALATRDTIEVPESAVLHLNLDGVITEQQDVTDAYGAFLSGNDRKDIPLRDVVDAVNLATDDERIKAIVLDVSDLIGGSLSQLDEIAVALQSFKESGKPILSFADSYTQRQYYLASFADQIYLDRHSKLLPGGVFMTGLRANQLYLKSTLEKLHIQTHVFQAGTFKDAVEIFLRDDMSELSKVATRAWLEVVWEQYLATISEQRGIATEKLSTYIDRYDQLLEQAGSDSALMAEQHGLIDARLTRVEWDQRLTDITGPEDDTYTDISLRHYLSAMQETLTLGNPFADQIAVIVVDGPITDDEDALDSAGARAIADLIREARTDDDIKALVVRINSPGGTVSGSELIRSELEFAREDGKVVVASMAGVAASGGYWIASAADKIVASNTTITGSIGAFGVLLTLDQTLDRLGMHADGVGTTKLSGAFDALRPLNPMTRNIMQQSISKIYQDFVNLVAAGRGMSFEDVDKIAQGRVWAGATALELGLVDALGTRKDAIESAAALAGIQDYEVVYLEQKLSPQEQFTRILRNIGLAGAGFADMSLAAALAEYLRVDYPLAVTVASGQRDALAIPAEIRNILTASQQPITYAQCLSCQVDFQDKSD